MIGVMTLLFLLGHNVMAESRTMRCSGKLIKVGEFEGEVIAKCGDPQHVETFKDYPGKWVSKYQEDAFGRFKAPYLLKGPIKKEVWTYQPGPNRLPYFLTFHQGRLMRIQVGGRTDPETHGKN
jgi:hypothetical protein